MAVSLPTANWRSDTGVDWGKPVSAMGAITISARPHIAGVEIDAMLVARKLSDSQGVGACGATMIVRR